MSDAPEAALTADEQAYVDTKIRPESFPFKVATMLDGPCAGERFRPKARAILVPHMVPGSNPPVIAYIRYRRAPGRLADGSQRYIHVDRDGAW